MAAGCGRRASWRAAHPAPLCAWAAERGTRPSAWKEGEINVLVFFYFPIANPLGQAFRPWDRRVGRLGASAAGERLAQPGPEFRGTLCPHLPSVQDRESASTCAGAKRRRPASSLEKNPPTALPSLLPLKKRVKKKKIPPTPGGAATFASQACAPGPRRGLHGSATRPQTSVRAPARAPQSLERP